MHKFRHIWKGLLCRLLRSLYGLSESRWLWNKNVIAFYKSIGFKQLNGNPSILIRQTKKKTSVVSVYVDDFLLASNTIDTLQTLKDMLAKKYKMKDLSKVKTIIRWQITRDIATHMMNIDQSAFIRDLVIEEELTECKANVIPMKAGSAIEMLDPDDYNETNLHGYQCLIEKLMYLVCGTRPDIAFAVGQLSKHNADPRKGHFWAAKRVVRYLKGTMQTGLIYGWENSSPRDPSPFGLKGYANSNFVGNPEDRKLVMGYIFLSEWRSSILEQQKAKDCLHLNNRSQVYCTRSRCQGGCMDPTIHQRDGTGDDKRHHPAWRQQDEHSPDKERGESAPYQAHRCTAPLHPWTCW